MKTKFLLFFSFIMFVACDGGVSQKDYDKLRAECDDLMVQNYKYQEELLVYKTRYGELPTMNKENKEFGIWSVKYYVDDFGEPTKEGYVSTDLFGTFSNSATTNSELKVRFLIDKKIMRIQLYEYAGNHPIKGSGFITFKAKNEKDEIVEFETYNNETGNNTVTDASHEFNDKPLRDFLLNSREIKFIGTLSRGVEYKFTLKNADFLNDALSEI